VPCKQGERYRYEIPHYGVRNFARPGMTGAAQQAGWGGSRNIRKRAVSDARYVSTSSIKNDVRLLKASLLPKRSH
jgi:lipopolysaccharide/colanic/teichoic acid biosynthesis glycosyltransferase